MSPTSSFRLLQGYIRNVEDFSLHVTYVLKVVVMTVFIVLFMYLVVYMDVLSAYILINPFINIRRKPHRHMHSKSTNLPMDSLEDYLNAIDSTYKISGLVDIIRNVATSCVMVKNIIAQGSILNVDEKAQAASQINASGDKQKPVDVLANDILKSSLLSLPSVCSIISEEEDQPLKNNDSGPYIVAYDPLDGSSNIDCAIPTGTIFAVYRSSGAEIDLSRLIGSNIVAAGYVMYSGSTEMVISFSNSSQGFTLHPSSDTWYHTRKNLNVPERGQYYSLNEGRSSDWPKGLQNYISDIKGYYCHIYKIVSFYRYFLFRRKIGVEEAIFV